MSEPPCPKTTDGHHLWRDVGTKTDPGGKDVRCMLCNLPKGSEGSPLKRT